MKTTVELPDDLVREIESRAEREGRKLQDAVADLLRKGLAPADVHGYASGPTVPKHLPFIKARPANPLDVQSLNQQEWCDWLKDLEQQHEVERYEKAFGHQYVDRADG